MNLKIIIGYHRKTHIILWNTHDILRETYIKRRNTHDIENPYYTMHIIFFILYGIVFKNINQKNALTDRSLSITLDIKFLKTSNFKRDFE